ncbi:MAG: hypothetical protein CO065_16975, partial [Comamonadaceae bacterium CG_4_9_14_0_8_um_filter_57_21]
RCAKAQSVKTRKMLMGLDVPLMHEKSNGRCCIVFGLQSRKKKNPCQGLQFLTISITVLARWPVPHKQETL